MPHQQKHVPLRDARQVHCTRRTDSIPSIRSVSRTIQRVVALITMAAAAWTAAVESYHGTAPTTYRPPVIVLAQPADGAVLGASDAMAVLRFSAHDQLDPIDALSLDVSVDGIDRTSLFTLALGEAWGRLWPADEQLTPGQHDVRARICTVRGTCSVVRVVVTVALTTGMGRRAIQP